MQKHAECCRKISNLLDGQNNSKIAKYFDSIKNKSNFVPSRLKNKITNALVEFVILDGRPFEIVNGPGFINLVECVLGAGRTLLESSTVSASDLRPPSPLKKSQFSLENRKLRFCDRMIVCLLLFQKHYGVFQKTPFLTENFCHFCNGLP